MNIVVLNGSPKGELSVTLQSVAYLAARHPEVTFTTVHVAQRIKRLEGDRAAFDQIVEQVRAADAVLWSFPLYVLCVHANYKRFIELLFERGAQTAFAGKYAAALSTSIHFFDHTAHNYIHAVSDDLGLRFVDSFSADMYDLLTEEGRAQLETFGRHFFDAIQRQGPTPRRHQPLITRDFDYQPATPSRRVPTAGKRVVLLHDAQTPDENLAHMVARCRAALDGEVTVVNLHDLAIKGSCQGCLLCGADNQCVYDGKDDYREFYTQTVMTADVLIYAGRMVDRYLSARWKMVFDRIFFNTHTPVLVGKQVALVISGPISQEPNLLEMLRGFFEFQGANLVGLVSDEAGSSAEVDGWLDQLMARAVDYAASGYRRPQSFLGVGGIKIFRDDVYGRLRLIFPADHRAFQRMGIYKTFPQADLRAMATNLVVAPIVNLAPVRRRFNPMIKTQMVAAHRQVVARAGGKHES